MAPDAITSSIDLSNFSIHSRPMDLVAIKKNVELGLMRTTEEFQRDMMLMFTNAIMYNSSDHNVYHMAQEMYDDVMAHIEVVTSSLAQQVNYYLTSMLFSLFDIFHIVFNC